MASDSYDGAIPINTGGYVDLVATYAGMANAAAWVQNRGPDPVVVAFSQSAAAPADAGAVLNPGDVWYGTAPHCWCTALIGSSAVRVGLV